MGIDGDHWGDEPSRPVDIPSVKPEVKQTDPKGYSTAVVDSEYIPSAGLKTFIAGSSWKVTYWSNLLSSDDQVNDAGDGPSVTNQLRKIQNLELKVQSDGLTEGSDENGRFTVTGTADMYPGIRAIKGDRFLADIGDGQSGLFTVTNAPRATIYRESVYEIEFTLTDHRDTLDAAVADLEQRTIESLYFRLDRLRYGRKHLVTSEELATEADLEQLKDVLIKTYMSEFYDPNNRLIQHPVEGLYDPFIPKFVLSLLNGNEHPWLTKTKQPIADSDFFTRFDTVLTAMLEGDDPQTILTQQVAIEGIEHAWRSPAMFSLTIYGIRQIYVGAGWTMYLERSNPPEPLALDDQTPLDPKPTFHPVDHDAGYILSNDFYLGGINTSEIEDMIKKRLLGETYEISRLSDIYHDVKASSPVDRFYYYPLLIALIIYGNRNN